MDGVGPAREDDDRGVEVGDGLEGAGAGDGEGEDGEGADAAGDEVGVLGAVVEDENKVGLHGFWVHGGRRRRRRKGFMGFVRGEENGWLWFYRGFMGKGQMRESLGF